jgi:hypothetical protein
MQPGVSYVERLRKEGKSSSTVGEAREGRATIIVDTASTSMQWFGSPWLTELQGKA